eukprot:1152593-Pelagomonas_calceolata.AAC.1
MNTKLQPRYYLRIKLLAPNFSCVAATHAGGPPAAWSWCMSSRSCWWSMHVRMAMVHEHAGGA